MQKNKKSKFGIGLLFGGVFGALAGLFLAPKKGSQLRHEAAESVEEIKKILAEKTPDEIISQIFGKVTEESKIFFNKSKSVLANKLKETKVALSKIEKEKYQKIVGEVINEVESDYKFPSETLNKLKKYLENDFKKLSEKPKPSKKKPRNGKSKN